jgi:hypothetical protein
MLEVWKSILGNTSGSNKIQSLMEKPSRPTNPNSDSLREYLSDLIEFGRTSPNPTECYQELREVVWMYGIPPLTEVSCCFAAGLTNRQNKQVVRR